MAEADVFQSKTQNHEHPIIQAFDSNFIVRDTK